MNRWQTAQQIAFLIRNKVWPDAPSEPVVRTAVVSDLPVEAVYTAESTPFVLVKPVGNERDEEHPERDQVSRYEVSVAAEGWTDVEGTSALVGANRVAPSGGLTHQGTSQGRGLLEIEEMVRQACTSRDGSGAFVGACSDTSAELVVMPGGVVVSTVKLVVEAWSTTRDRTYPAPRLLTATGAAGVVSLTWAGTPRRWDTLGGATPQYAVYYQAGSTAPAYGAGTLYTPTAGSTAASITTGAGTWSFALFSLFDETGNGVNERQTSNPTTALAVAA